MPGIKTYHIGQEDERSVTFELKRMEAIHKASGGQADTPHRHDYYTVIWTLEASGKHIIDFIEYPLEGDQVFFISPGQVHQMIPAGPPAGFVILFSPEFLVQNNIRAEFISDLKLFRHCGESPPLMVDPPLRKKLGSISSQMEEILAHDIPLQYEAIGALLKLFLIHCNNACHLDANTHTQDTQAGIGLLKQFKEDVEAHFGSMHKVKDYATRLHVTPGHLNDIVKQYIGQPAKSYIQDRIVLQAKRLLFFTEKTNKEIAFELGFEDPAHFSSFFKKCTGQSPSSYRKQLTRA